jgi:hypothetical protein
MKKVFLGALLIALSTITQAQTQKGTWLLGGGAGFSSTSTGDAKESTVSFSPNLGYFLADNLSVGASAIVSSVKPDGRDATTTLAIGPAVRYYFAPLGSHAKLFANGSLGLGSVKTGSSDPVNVAAWAVSVGPAIFLNQSIALELAVGYSSAKVKDAADATNTLGVSVGFQIHFKK